MRAALGLLAALFAANAAASDFRSVADDAAVLYDAPSTQAAPLYVVSKYYPLEIIVDLESWAKVRDATGALAWIQKRELSDQRMVVVTGPSAEVRVRPEADAPVAFVASQNVALELLEEVPGGWARVRHEDDGANGYVRLDQVWGG